MTERYDNEFFKGLSRSSSAAQILAAVENRIAEEKMRLLTADGIGEVKIAQGSALVLMELCEALGRETAAPAPEAGISDM